MMDSLDDFIMFGVITIVVAVITAMALITFGAISVSGSWIVFAVAYMAIVVVAILPVRNYARSDKKKGHQQLNKQR